MDRHAAIERACPPVELHQGRIPIDQTNRVHALSVRENSRLVELSLVCEEHAHLVERVCTEVVVDIVLADIDLIRVKRMPRNPSAATPIRV
jgi:hypothetical protein